MKFVQRLMALAVCISSSLIASTAKGEFVLDIQRIGSGVVQPNSVVSFDVFISAPTGSPENLLTGFGLFFDISPVAGKGLPSNLGAINAVDYVFPNNQYVDFALAEAYTTANFDFSVSAETSGSVTIPVAPASPRKLFRLNVNVGSLAAGTYTLEYVDDPIGEGVSLRDGFPPLLGSGDFGRLASSSNSSVTFEAFGDSQAVPEPGSLGLLCTVGGGYIVARRIRRRKATQEKTESV